jgi:sterol 24-C-methyltransferase
MKVLDVSCGVGGPAREIASFSGCNVIGLNNNSYQISRVKAHAEKTCLSDKVSFVQGNFMVSKINLALFCASCREADYPTVSIESLTRSLEYRLPRK